MEKRAFIAVMLMFLVLVMYEVLMRPTRVAPPEPQRSDSPVVTADLAKERTAIPSREEFRREESAGTEMEIGDDEFPSAIPEKRIVVDTDLFRAVLSNVGPRILSWQLKNFSGVDSDWAELVPDSLEGGLFLGVGGWEKQSGAMRVFETNVDRLVLGEGTPDRALVGEVRFTSAGGHGPVITEVLTFRNAEYLADMSISVSDPAAEKGDPLRLGWISSAASTEADRTDENRYFSTLVSVDSEVIKKQVKHLKKEPMPLRRGEVHWAGLKTKYFTSVLVPRSGNAMAVEMGGEEGAERLGFSILFAATERGGWRIDTQLYLGPLDYRILKDLDLGLEQYVDFGHKLIRPLSKLIYWMLLTTHKWIPNYGLVIIILSVVTKVLFYPLTQKSMKSMQRMQDLQPKMAALKEKHKKDPKRMNQEVMKLYKDQGVNPVGGCFPLLLQSPVFFALYAVLQRTIELRQAPFVLWINDLSLPDVVLSLPAPLPALSLLPILMGVSMLLQQKLTTTSGAGDPRQKMMGYMMPIFMTVIFFRMPSGLVLYWLVNTVMSIGQQYVMVKRGKAAAEGEPA